MKAYLITTSLIFGLITMAHILRMILESSQFARDPWFLSLTILTTGLCVWGGVLFRRLPRS